MAKNTKSIINKIQERVDREFKQLQQVNDTIDFVTRSLSGEVKDFDLALQGLDELRRVLGDIKGGVEAAHGNLAEGQELLQELVEGSSSTATLINGLVNTFMRGDYSILLQALAALDKPLLSEAIKAMPHEQRRELIDALIKVETESD